MPGLAHFFVFWGFLILRFTIIEAVGALFHEDFPIPLIGKSPVLGFLEDFFGVAVMLGIITFAVLRAAQQPGDQAARLAASTARTPVRPGSSSG